MMPAIHRRAVCEICGEEILGEWCYTFSGGACICEECVNKEIDKIDPRLEWWLWDFLGDHHRETPDWWEEEEGMP